MVLIGDVELCFGELTDCWEEVELFLEEEAPLLMRGVCVYLFVYFLAESWQAFTLLYFKIWTHFWIIRFYLFILEL